MEAHIIQRIGAYLIDMIIVSFIVLFLTFWIPQSEKYNNAVKKSEELFNEFLEEDSKLSYDEYYNESSKLRYTLDKESVIINIIQIVVIVGYFGSFAYYNNGQTFGKKLLKIKIVPSIDSELNHINLIGRALLVEGVFTTLVSIVFVFIVDYKKYSIISYFFSGIQFLFIISCFVMILSRNDKRGLHDIIFRTKVIKE